MNELDDETQLIVDATKLFEDSAAPADAFVRVATYLAARYEVADE